MNTDLATQKFGQQLVRNVWPVGLRVRRLGSFLGALALLTQLLGATAGCAGRTQGVAPGGKPTANSSESPDAQSDVAIPFALCRSFGTAGTPCYPTNVDIGSRVISPCRERQRGHCELSGPRHTMACLLAPVVDGKTCGAAGVCKDGVCVAQ